MKKIKEDCKMLLYEKWGKAPDEIARSWLSSNVLHLYILLSFVSSTKRSCADLTKFYCYFNYTRLWEDWWRY